MGGFLVETSEGHRPRTAPTSGATPPRARWILHGHQDVLAAAAGRHSPGDLGGRPLGGSREDRRVAQPSDGGGQRIAQPPSRLQMNAMKTHEVVAAFNMDHRHFARLVA